MTSNHSAEACPRAPAGEEQTANERPCANFATRGGPPSQIVFHWHLRACVRATARACVCGHFVVAASRSQRHPEGSSVIEPAPGVSEEGPVIRMPVQSRSPRKTKRVEGKKKPMGNRSRLRVAWAGDRVQGRQGDTPDASRPREEAISGPKDTRLTACGRPAQGSEVKVPTGREHARISMPPLTSPMCWI